MTNIIPSILAPDEQTFRAQIDAIRGNLPMIQLDITDGKFVPNKTWAEPNAVKEVAGTMDVELHLMVEHPMKELKRWTDIPQVKRALFHFESKDDIQKTIKAIHANGWEASIVLNPETSVDVLDPYLANIEGVMFMGVHPGKQGQTFIPETIDRIKTFKAKGTKHVVELDGGVNEATLPSIIESGVDAVCPGSAVFGSKRDPKENIRRLNNIITHHI